MSPALVGPASQTQKARLCQCQQVKDSTQAFDPGAPEKFFPKPKKGMQMRIFMAVLSVDTGRQEEISPR